MVKLLLESDHYFQFLIPALFIPNYDCGNDSDNILLLEVTTLIT